jgi:peptidoglycan L-alanyl-D-glutamate endopeptidase CwlK
LRQPWDTLKDFDGDKVSDWMEVVNYFKSQGWEHGGDWKNFKDQPHFQIKKENGESYNWRELKAKIDSGDYFVKNGIKYPSI